MGNKNSKQTTKNNNNKNDLVKSSPPTSTPGVARQHIEVTSVDPLESSGRFGPVYYGEDMKSAKSIVLKKINFRDLKGEQLVMGVKADIRKLKQLRGDVSITPILDCYTNRGQLVVINERAENVVDLRSVMDKRGALEPDLALTVLGIVTEAVIALDSVGLCFSDLKPKNILLKRAESRGSPTQGAGDRHFRGVCIGDFGFDKRRYSLYKHQYEAALTLYTPPELFDQSSEFWRGFDKSSVLKDDFDKGKAMVWTLGCILYEMVAGASLFEDKALIRGLEDSGAIFGVKGGRLPHAIQEVVEKCLRPDPSSRVDLTQLSYLLNSTADRISLKSIKTQIIEQGRVTTYPFTLESEVIGLPQKCKNTSQLNKHRSRRFFVFSRFYSFLE